MPSIQKQISLIFNKKKQQIFVDYFTYQRIRTQVFNYPKKYQNNFTYYIDLDNNLFINVPYLNSKRERIFPFKVLPGI